MQNQNQVRKLVELHQKVEFDLNYFGGDYSGVGSFVYIPESAVEEHGSIERAFIAVTGHAPQHIINTYDDERFTADGAELEDDVAPEMIPLEQRIEVANQIGFKVHCGEDNVEAPHLVGRWWWSLCNDDWSGIDVSPELYVSEQEAWNAAIAFIDTDPELKTLREKVEKRYVSGYWTHIFGVGTRDQHDCRIVFDRVDHKLLHLEILDGVKGWMRASEEERLDVEDSLKTANDDAIENPGNWNLDESTRLPEWASSNRRSAEPSREMPAILHLPSRDGHGEYDLFVFAPAEMEQEEAVRIVNAEIGRANAEDARNCDKGGEGCDDGLCVEDSIKTNLTKQGFVFVKPRMTYCWDEKQ